MINFKKITSMVVMLSLMLGACGKSPARRDVTMSEDGNNVVEHDDEGTKKGSWYEWVSRESWGEWSSRVNPWSEENKNKKGKRNWHDRVSLRGAGVGAVAMGVVAAVGTAAILAIAKFSLPKWQKFNLPPGKGIAGYSLTFGAIGVLLGAVYGEKAATGGDGLGKVLLKTVCAGLVVGCVAGVAATVIGAREVYKKKFVPPQKEETIASCQKVHAAKLKEDDDEQKREAEQKLKEEDDEQCRRPKKEVELHYAKNKLKWNLENEEVKEKKMAVLEQELNNLWFFIFKNKWTELYQAKEKLEKSRNRISELNKALLELS